MKKNAPEEQRNITLTILKNKLGETGCSVDFKYYPAYNLFKEVEEFSPSAESKTIICKW